MKSNYSYWQTANIIVWLDGTVRPWRGHKNCDGGWNYDGQVYAFSCSCKKDRG